jgi:hypothetical protein
MTPGLWPRLFKRPARTCLDKVLLVVDPALGGYLIDKLNGTPGICGNRMPAVGPPLSFEEIECVKTWLRTTR